MLDSVSLVGLGRGDRRDHFWKVDDVGMGFIRMTSTLRRQALQPERLLYRQRRSVCSCSAPNRERLANDDGRKGWAVDHYLSFAGMFVGLGTTNLSSFDRMVIEKKNDNAYWNYNTKERVAIITGIPDMAVADGSRVVG